MIGKLFQLRDSDGEEIGLLWTDNIEIDGEDIKEIHELFVEDVNVEDESDLDEFTDYLEKHLEGIFERVFVDADVFI